MKNIGLGFAAAGWLFWATSGWSRRAAWSPSAYIPLAFGKEGKELLEHGKAALKEVFPAPLTLDEWLALLDPGDGLAVPLAPPCEAAGVFVDYVDGGGGCHVEDIWGLRDRRLAEEFWMAWAGHVPHEDPVFRALAEEVLARDYFLATDVTGGQHWSRGAASAARGVLGRPTPGVRWTASVGVGDRKPAVFPQRDTDALQVPVGFTFVGTFDTVEGARAAASA